MPQLHLGFGCFLSQFHIKCARDFFKKIVMLIDPFLLSKILYLFSRTSHAYVQIYLNKIYASLQLLKK